LLEDERRMPVVRFFNTAGTDLRHHRCYIVARDACVPVKIAQISPLIESVPPRLYGGTERVVAYLTDELVRQGHEVTLFASGDSRTCADLVAPCARALRLDPDHRDALAQHLVMIEEVLRRADVFDLVHFHVD